MYLLLVDYDFLSSAEIKEMLKQSPEDADIINCSSTTALLSITNKLTPDIIIIDFALIEENLAELFAALRKNTGGAHILTLVDPDDSDLLNQVIEEGNIDDFIVKPIRKEDFMARVHLAAKRKREALKDTGPASVEDEQAEDMSSGQLFDFGSHKRKTIVEPEDDQQPEPDLLDSIDESDLKPESEPDDAFTETTLDEPTAFDGPYSGDDTEFSVTKDTTEANSGLEDPFFEEDAFQTIEDAPEAASEGKDSTYGVLDDFFEAEPDEEPEQGSSPDISGTNLEFESESEPESVPEPESEPELESFFKDDFKPETEPFDETEDSAALFEDELPGPPEDQVQAPEDFSGLQKDENRALPDEDNFANPPAEEAGPVAAKPAADFLNGDLLHGAEHDIPQPVRRVQPDREEDDIDFENLFESASEPAEESWEEPDFSEDEEPDWGSTPPDDYPVEDFDQEQPVKKIDQSEFRRITALPGESADDFLFGDSTPEGSLYGNGFLNEFADSDFPDFEDEEDEVEEVYVPKKSRHSKERKSGGSGFSRFLSVFGNVIFIFLLLVMATLSFFLIQSRIAGGVPQVAGYQMYIVLSGSMNPEFDTGSLAFVREIETDQLGVGDIITYRSQPGSDSLTTHRIVEVQTNETTQFVTRGDANNVNDPNPVLAENVVGQVTGSIPYLGYLFNFVQTRQGLILLIFVPGVLIIIFELSKIMKYLTQGDKSKNNRRAKKQARYAED